MKPAYRLILLLICFSTGCTGAPFGRGNVPTARPITATATAARGTADGGTAFQSPTVESTHDAVPLQGTSTPAPATSTPAPATSTPLPATSTPLPATSTPVPATATPMPATATPFSATSTPLPTPSPTPLPTDTPGPTPTPLSLVAEVGSNFTNVYSGPGLDYTLLAVLTAGFKVEVIGADDGGSWLVIRLPRGAQGWVPATNLETGPGLAGLAIMDDPPVPAPTGTTSPAPEVVVSPNALAPDAKYTIAIRFFQPQERITVKIVFEENGGLVFKFVVTTRVDGSHDIVLTTNTRARAGAYLLTITGDAGSYAETRFFVGPPETGSD